MDTEIELKTFGQVAYEAFCEQMGGTAGRSRPKPIVWENLSDTVKAAWCVAGRAVATASVSAVRS